MGLSKVGLERRAKSVMRQSQSRSLGEGHIGLSDTRAIWKHHSLCITELRSFCHCLRWTTGASAPVCWMRIADMCVYLRCVYSRYVGIAGMLNYIKSVFFYVTMFECALRVL
jgi:hypothetical protein